MYLLIYNHRIKKSNISNLNRRRFSASKNMSRYRLNKVYQEYIDNNVISQGIDPQTKYVSQKYLDNNIISQGIDPQIVSQELNLSPTNSAAFINENNLINNFNSYSSEFHWNNMYNNINRKWFEEVNPINEINLPSVFKDITLYNDYSLLENALNHLNYFLISGINNPLFWATMWWISIYYAKYFHDIARRYGLVNIYNSIITTYIDLFKELLNEHISQKLLVFTNQTKPPIIKNVNKIKDLCTVNIGKVGYIKCKIKKIIKNGAWFYLVSKIVNKFVFDRIFKNIIGCTKDNNNIFNTSIISTNNNIQVFMMANNMNIPSIDLVWLYVRVHTILAKIDGTLLQIHNNNTCLILNINDVHFSIFINEPCFYNFTFVKIKINNIEHTAMVAYMIEVPTSNRLLFSMPTRLFNTNRRLLVTNGHRLDYNIISARVTNIIINYIDYSHRDIRYINSNIFYERDQLLFTFDLHLSNRTLDIRFIRLADNKLFFFDFNDWQANLFFTHNLLIRDPQWTGHRIGDTVYLGLVINDVNIERYPDEARSLTIQEQWLRTTLAGRNSINTRGFGFTSYQTTNATSNVLIMIHIL